MPDKLAPIDAEVGNFETGRQIDNWQSEIYNVLSDPGLRTMLAL